MWKNRRMKKYCKFARHGNATMKMTREKSTAEYKISTEMKKHGEPKGY